MKGRGNKTPTVLSKLRGNPSKRPLPKNEIFPKIASSIPEPPEHLDIVGKKYWRRYAAVLYPLGLLTVADEISLEFQCDRVSQWWKNRKWRNAKGSVYFQIDDAGRTIAYKAYPQIADYNNLLRQIDKWHTEFGMTPASRARMGTGHPNEKPTEPLDAFLENSFGVPSEVGEA